MNLEGFEFLESLGAGGMATVYKARQISLDRLVAVKIFSPRFEPTPEDIEHFRNEAKVAAQLKHPGLVQVYDAVFHEDLYCFVMELVEGYTTSQWCVKKGRLREADVLNIADCVAEALGYAWKTNRLTHCDIKPENIMIDSDGTVKILDLGLCKTAQTIKKGESESDVYGTPQYISPEQAIGQSELDCRTDIYSLGATMYHLATGRMLFAGMPDGEAMDAQVRSQAPNPKDVVPELSASFCALLEKMLAKNRENRQTDWLQVREDIAAVRAGRSLTSENPLPGLSTVVSGKMPAAAVGARAGKKVSIKVGGGRKAKIGDGRHIKLNANAAASSSAGGRIQTGEKTSGRKLTPFVLVAVLAVLAALGCAMLYSAKKTHAFQQREEQARAALAEAETWVAGHPTEFDAGVSRLREVADSYPSMKPMADQGVAKLNERKREYTARQVSALVDKLVDEAAAMVSEGRFEQAVEHIGGYAGRYAEESKEARRKAVETLSEDHRRHLEDVRRRTEEESARKRREEELAKLAERTESVRRELAESLASGGIFGAKMCLDRLSLETPEIFRDGEPKELSDTIQGAVNAERAFERTFSDQIGKNITLKMANGTVITGDLARFQRNTYTLVLSANTIERTIRILEIDPDEVFRRFGNSEESGAVLARLWLCKRLNFDPGVTTIVKECARLPEAFQSVARDQFMKK